MRLEMLSWGIGHKQAVLIHGLSARAALWDAMANGLSSAGYRSWAPDLRGHGRSPRGSYTIHSWVADLIENLPANPDLAIGHSLGGILLLKAVSRLRPKRAVYIDPPWIADQDPRRTIAQFEARKSLSRAAVAGANPSWTPQENDLRYEGFQMWDPRTASAFILTREADYTPTKPPLQPSLVIVPDPSPLAPTEVVDRIRASEWDVYEFPGAGHYVHLDERKAVLDQVVTWLEREQ
ncbi:MAG TPA: alpha/beta hydrolase [Candidatus Dormibacteraeota bacterium]|nr:alpha/beta hydrolase [Candidatus Dormibacteraeota bacterium]